MPPASRRGHVSIASLFDAAQAQGGTPNRRGYHIAPPGSSSRHPSNSSDSRSHGNGTIPSLGPSTDRTNNTPSTVSTSSSPTLQAVRQRILEELATEQQSSSTTHHGRRGDTTRPGSKLQEHRQRAMAIAFGSGADGETPRRLSKSKASLADTLGSVEEDELEVSAVEFSLNCPYSQLPITTPVRSRDCQHVQCCDLESWMVLLEKYRSLRDPKGPCPVCEQRVAASSLEVDLWMLSIIQLMPSGTHLIVLEKDGCYRSGDISRVRRKEELMMEIDCTQEDYANLLGEVIDDSDHDEAPVCLEPNLRPPISAPKRTLVDRAPSPPVVRVKQEMGVAGDSPFTQSAKGSQEGGVVVVHYVEAKAQSDRTALPSQLRLWRLYCGKCRTIMLKGEDGRMESCGSCGAEFSVESCFLVRQFDESSRVSMELTPDNTLILCGVDAVAPYLYRAGFFRTLFRPEDYAMPTIFSSPPPGVWVSTYALTRFELDFLEACCHRVACGDNLVELGEMMVPSLFRIPRRRAAGSQSGPWSQGRGPHSSPFAAAAASSGYQ